jgi:hypothetical protein
MATFPQALPDEVTTMISPGKASLRASNPKVDTTFEIHLMLHFLRWRIVRSGKPEPLFRTMRRWI